MVIFEDFLLQLTVIATLIFTFQIFFAERSERDRRVKFVLSALFGISILLCMSYPIHITSTIHIDIRIIPLLLGTLYGGLRTGVALSILIVLYRMYLGFDLGLYTTTLTLLISMPVMIYYQKAFTTAEKTMKIRMALLLSVIYCFVGIVVTSIFRGLSYKVLQVQLVYLIITIIVVLLFTALIETIKDTMRKNRQLQLDVKDAEIAFLRCQIKPHFLYNTLNSIAALCVDEPRKAEELTLHFAQYLRNSFDFKQLRSMTTIENELDLVRTFLNIENASFGDRIQVKFEVDANPDFLIPPLILQPLVENAIKHGLMPRQQEGTVIISAKQNANAAVSFAVEDNGDGMNEDLQREILKPDAHAVGIGLWNINQRIGLLYGESIHIESAEGAGTKIWFNIPARAIDQREG